MIQIKPNSGQAPAKLRPNSRPDFLHAETPVQTGMNPEAQAHSARRCCAPSLSIVICATSGGSGKPGGTCYDGVVPSGKETSGRDLLLRTDEDILFVRPVGVLSVEDTNRIVRQASDVFSRHGHLFLIADMMQAGLLPAESRRIMARFGAEKTPLALAMYNVSPLGRAVNALLFGAIGLFSKKRLNVMEFSSEESAREWLLAERRRLLP